MDTFGLNKAARIKAQRETERLENTPPPLDPEFPYSVIGFDPFFFGAQEEWPKEEN